MLNNIDDGGLRPALRKKMTGNAVLFLAFFLSFLGILLTADGLAVTSNGEVLAESYKYLHNLLEMPVVLGIFLAGVVLVLVGLYIPLRKSDSRNGIWFTGFGTVLAVLALFLIAGLNGTCYYPSSHDPQSSLHLANSCSSLFTLTTMSYVSLLIPFVLAYIVYAWHSIDKKSLTRDELQKEEHKY